MAVKETVKGVKVVLKFEKGSQTVGNCDLAATTEQLYGLAGAVETLIGEPVVDRVKVLESSLINE